MRIFLLFIIAISLFQSVLGQKRKDSSSLKTINTAGRDINYVKRDLNTAGRDIKIDSRKYSKVVKDSSNRSQKVIDQSNNQGGININAESGNVNVTIPEERSGDITTNFQIIGFHDYVVYGGTGNDFKADVLKFSPKFGRWIRPYYGIKVGEFLSLEGIEIGFINPTMTSRNFPQWRLIEGDTIEFQIHTTEDFVTTPETPFGVFFRKRIPSIIIFGDLSDPKKNYIRKIDATNYK